MEGRRKEGINVTKRADFFYIIVLNKLNIKGGGKERKKIKNERKEQDRENERKERKKMEEGNKKERKEQGKRKE